ncbi:ABC transporter substrate-binding protein [Brachybacterium sp. AOP43-C2-M15]|uniref:ABC transporter substrate-binding protein n=1 Tax=Brachybacterium sp. AOP43-C2-M15 TaxID=3457661 RepID=UPI004033236A
MMRRRQLLAMGAGAAALTAAGCAGFTNSDAPAGDAGVSGDDLGPGTTPQTLLCWANPEQLALFEKTLEAFTEESGIEVTVQSVSGGEYFNKINSMNTSNSLPDVFWADNNSGVVSPMAANGRLYDWTPLLDDPPEGAELDLDDFGPGYLDLFTVDDKVIGMPQEVNVDGVYYNKRLFEEAGVDLPSPEWTWDDLFDAAESLAVTEGGKVTRYGMQTGLPTITDPFGASMYSMSNGGPGLAGDASTTFRGITSIEAGPEFREGAQRFVDSVKAGGMNGPDFSTQNTIATFMNGEVPMMYGGQWFTGFYGEALKDDWGFVSMPQGSSGSVSILQGNAFCSPVDLPDPLATWKLIHYMLTTGFNEAYAEIGITPLAYTPGSEGFFTYMENKAEAEAGYGEVISTVRAELENPNKSGTTFLDRWANRAVDVTKAVWNPMLNDKTPVDEAVDDFVSQLGALAES